MQKNLIIGLALKSCLLGGLLFSFILYNTAAAVAQSTGTGEAANSASSKVEEPPGYTYNPETGMWENGVYAWDPVTKQTKPLTDVDYSYNPDTNKWDTKDYYYDSATNSYEPNTPKQSTTGSSAQTTEPEAQISSDLPANDTGQSSSTDPSKDVAGSRNGNQAAMGSGSGSGNDKSNEDDRVDAKAALTGAFDLFYNNEISNNINGSSTSGDASVAGNTNGGNATSGDATTIASIYNLIESSISFLGPQADLYSFIFDIWGDYVGDILFDPGELPSTEASNIDNVINADLDLEANTNNTINNDIWLTAQSGDTQVKSNTAGGDATSGDAAVIANLVNIIYSAIAANDSFVGMLNIHGDFEGDVLISPEYIEQLLASNVPRATLNTSQISNLDVLADINNTSVINNNINTMAQSGEASVDANTAAGDASSGDALNQITILNLTGHQFVGSNSLLVFVNVLGEWVGLLIDAPAGATAAAYGSGASTDSMFKSDLDADIDVNNTSTINNNINLAAYSGDADVSYNTTAGDASTGDASTSLNILNIMNTQFGLSEWFGILFINVLGNWLGSFGIDTAYGDVIATTPPSGNNANNSANASSKNHNQSKFYSYFETIRIYTFQASSNGLELVPITTYGNSNISSQQDQQKDYDGAVLAGAQTPPTAEQQLPGSLSRVSFFNPWTLSMFGIAGLLFAAERLVAYRQKGYEDGLSW